LVNESWEESSVEGLEELSDLIVIDRSENICSLSRDVSRINEMFKMLQSIVSSQGENIDNIEKNIQTSVIHTEKGNELLVDAEKSKWEGIKIKLITGVVIVFGAIGTFIGLIK
jgi:t-SNARE complex subunit (syntaxin)